MNWWKLATNFDNPAANMAELAPKVLADPAILQSIEQTNEAKASDVARVLGCTWFQASQICKLLPEYFRHTPQAQAFQQKQLQLQQKDKDDQRYFYHVTTYRNLPSIKANGLIPNGAGINFEGWYEGHSKGKTFLCSANGVHYWKGKIEENEETKQMNQRRYRPSKPVVLRILKQDVSGHENDSAGSRDSRNECISITTPIPPNKIQIAKMF